MTELDERAREAGQGLGPTPRGKTVKKEEWRVGDMMKAPPYSTLTLAARVSFSSGTRSLWSPGTMGPWVRNTVRGNRQMILLPQSQAPRSFSLAVEPR